MSLPDISIPDIQQDDLEKSHTAAYAVTHYAQASVMHVTGVENIAGLFGPMQAQNWLDHIYPAVTHSLPQAIIDFNEVFQRISQDILDTLQSIGKQHNMPAANQRRFVDGSLNNLINVIIRQQQIVNNVQQQVRAYVALVNSYDHRVAAQTTQNSVQSVLGAWANLQKKYLTVIAGLDDTADSDYATHVQHLDLEAAQAGWKRLAKYASALIANNN